MTSAAPNRLTRALDRLERRLTAWVLRPAITALVPWTTPLMGSRRIAGSAPTRIGRAVRAVSPLLGLLLLWATAGAQGITVRGRVADAQSRESMPYVRVVKSAPDASSQGTITDAEGRFQLMGLSGADMLVFSCLGYLTEQVSVQQLLQRGGNVQLHPSSVLLPTVELATPRLTAREIVERAIRRWRSNIHTGYRLPRLVHWSDWVRIDSLGAYYEGISAYVDSGYFFPPKALDALTLESRLDTHYTRLAAAYADPPLGQQTRPVLMCGVLALPPPYTSSDLAAQLLRTFDPFRRPSQGDQSPSPMRLLVDLDLDARWLRDHTFRFDTWVSVPDAPAPLARIAYIRHDTLYTYGRDKPVLTMGYLLIDLKQFRVYELEHRVQWTYLGTWMTFAQVHVRYTPDPALRGKLRVDRIQRGYEFLAGYSDSSLQRKVRVHSLRVLDAKLPPKTFRSLYARPRPQPRPMVGSAPDAWPWSLVVADLP